MSVLAPTGPEYSPTDVGFHLSSAAAVGMGYLFTVLFVGSLYVWRNAITQHRDHPTVVKQRIISVSVVSVASGVILSLFAPVDTSDVWSRVQWVASVTGVQASLSAVASGAVALLLTAILFLGPLVADEAWTKDWWVESFEGDLMWLRNVVVCPLAEEWVFRACVCCFMIASDFSVLQTIFISPLFFGTAHLHHVMQQYPNGAKAMLRASVGVLFQFLYTTVFGWYAAALLLRTGSVVGPSLAHAFCNRMGFPDFGGISSHPNRTVVAISYIVGLTLFGVLFAPLTDPALFKAL